jgi:hypothetical protein
MSDDLQQRKAQLFLNAYNNYVDSSNQIEKLKQHQQEAHKVLCDAAGLFLGLSDTEMNRILFYWDSIATDAKMILGIKD